jgi:hypothetical protein
LGVPYPFDLQPIYFFAINIFFPEFHVFLCDIHSLLTVQELRRSLCDHIVEKAEHYVGLFAAQELECDSMHAAIEFAKEHDTVRVFLGVPYPFDLQPIYFFAINIFFPEFHVFLCEIFEIVDVPKLQRHNHIWTDCIMFKYNFEDEFRVLKVAGTAKRGRTAEPQELTRKYTSRQKISVC